MTRTGIGLYIAGLFRDNHKRSKRNIQPSIKCSHLNSKPEYIPTHRVQLSNHQSTYRLFLNQYQQTNKRVDENSQSQILPVSQIQLTIIHYASDFTPIRINRLDNPIASDLIKLRELVATLVLSAQVDPERDNNYRRKNRSNLESYQSNIPHIALSKHDLPQAK